MNPDESNTAVGHQHRTPVQADRADRAVSIRTILTIDAVVVATAGGIYLLWQLRRILLFVVLAGFIALILNPAVSWLNRRGLRRTLAATIVFVAGVVVLVGLIYLFTKPIYDAGTHFAKEIPGFVDKAQHGRGRIGALIKHYHISSYVQKNAPKLQSYLGNLGGNALSIIRQVITGVVGLATVTVLAFFILMEAPNLARGFLGLLPAPRAERVARISAEAGRSVIGYVIGNALTSLIAGVIVYITLVVTGVPFAFVLALWVALVDLLPLVGGLLAGIPTVAIAFFHSTLAGVVALAVFLVYQQIENHILNPVIMSRTVRLNPLWVLLAVLVGAELLGFAGALLGIPVAGAAQVVAREMWSSRKARVVGWAEHQGVP
ncbi:MAG: AI-2E family transporter [Acidimicrobiales bacterium]